MKTQSDKREICKTTVQTLNESSSNLILCHLSTCHIQTRPLNIKSKRQQFKEGVWYETFLLKRSDRVKIYLVNHFPTNSFKVIPSPATGFDVNWLVGSVGRAVGASVAIAGDLFQRKVFWVHRQTHFWCAVLHIGLRSLDREAEGGKREDRTRGWWSHLRVWGRCVSGGEEDRLHDGCDLKREGEKNEIWGVRKGDTRGGRSKV